MKSLNLALGALLCLNLTTAQAAPDDTSMTPARELRKLSLHLRNLPPTPWELNDFRTALSRGESAEKLMNDHRQKWIESEAFNGVLKNFVLDLYRFPTFVANTGPMDSFLNDWVKSSTSSWDQLILDGRYSVKIGAGNTRENVALDYYRFLFSEQVRLQSPLWNAPFNAFADDLMDRALENSVREFLAQTPAQKESVAGLVTTPDFFRRYPTTKLNQNRKRAATVFRTLLCDDMKPVVLPGMNEDERIVHEALTGKPLDGRAQTIAERHGNDPQCTTCHYKLDPMAKTFKTSNQYLAAEPSPGALVFRRRDGTLVDIPVSGLNELMDVIRKQPEYLQCQVRHFWNQFIGQDVPLSLTVQNELIADFEKAKRNPKLFVAALTARPEFRRRADTINTTPIYQQAQSILQRCDSCHTYQAPPFAQMPIGFAAGEHPDWLRRIARKLDLNNDGANATMPPRDAGWKLTTDELRVLRLWIADGAQDDASKPTLTAEQIQAALPNGPGTKVSLRPTLFRTYTRFVTGPAIARLINNIGLGWTCSTAPTGFQQIGVYGVASPVTGQPPQTEVSTDYLALIKRCLSPTNPNLLSQIWLPSSTQDQTWNVVPEEQRVALVRRAVEHAFGVGILEEKELASMTQYFLNALNQSPNETQTISVNLAKVMRSVSLSEQFLSY